MTLEQALARIAELEAALKPFAKLGTLFAGRTSGLSSVNIYRPAAGDEYSLSSEHLLAAYDALEHGKSTDKPMTSAELIAKSTAEHNRVYEQEIANDAHSERAEEHAKIALANVIIESWAFVKDDVK